MVKENNRKPLKVLVTVFACNPYQGSEPGIGWGWVVSMSKVCQLTVLTTSCNRPEIEQAISEDAVVNAEFIYLDVMPGVTWLNERARRKVGVIIRLFLWQYRVKKFLSHWVKTHPCDILHHLTLGSFRMPFSVTGHGVVSVVGPVGGCEEFPEHLLPAAATKVRAKEKMRNWMNRLHSRYGVGMTRYQRADLTLSCTEEMRQVFARYGVDSPVFPNIGMPSVHHLASLADKPKGKALRLLFVGNTVYWKGLELALLALRQLPEYVTLSVIGQGPDRTSLEDDVSRLGLGERVNFVGAVSRSELLEMYQDYDVFFFPSLHDSGGMVVIEAMRSGLPVVCLKAGGPGISVTEKCGRVVSLGPKADVVKGLRQAVEFYLEDYGRIKKHGMAAAARVNTAYHWDKNAVKMISLYEMVLSDRQSKVES